MIRSYPDRYRLGDSDPASFDVFLGRDQSITLHLLEWDRRVAPDSSEVYRLAAVIRAQDAATTLVARDCVGGDPRIGTWSLELTDEDLAGLAWDVGEITRVVWLDLTAYVNDPDDNPGMTVPVVDPLGKSEFPIRVHRRVGG